LRICCKRFGHGADLKCPTRSYPARRLVGDAVPGAVLKQQKDASRHDNSSQLHRRDGNSGLPRESNNQGLGDAERRHGWRGCRAVRRFDWPVRGARAPRWGVVQGRVTRGTRLTLPGPMAPWFFQVRCEMDRCAGAAARRHRQLVGLSSRWAAIRTAWPWLRRSGDAGGRWCTRQIQGEMAPNPKLLHDDRLATDGIRAPGRQHPVQHRHADGSLSPLGREAAGSQTRSDQRLVTTHRRFH